VSILHVCVEKKIRKRDSRSKDVVERLNILEVIGLLCNVDLPTDYETIYARMQPPVPEEPPDPVEPPPPSPSMGVAVAGSESEVSKTAEESIAKRSIGGCQIKAVRCGCERARAVMLSSDVRL
jgi:hypothetical protein